MERDAEQPLLRADPDLAGEVEHGGPPSRGEADDAAGLLEHPQAVVVAGRDAHVRRSVEAARDALDVEVVRASALLRRCGRAEARERVLRVAEPRATAPATSSPRTASTRTARRGRRMASAC